jgi:sulfur-oxidizing protein SoxZ
MSSIKIRAKNKNAITTVKALINHPMETGMRKNKKTGKLIPAHYIQELNFEHNGKIVLDAHWGTAISKNPYLSFRFKDGNKGDEIKLSWKDNKGNSDSSTGKIK